MRKLARLKYRNWPLFFKMSVVFSFMSASLILSIGTVAYTVYRTSMERQIGEFVPQVLSQANKQVERYISDITSVLSYRLLQDLREINLDEGTPSLEQTLKLLDIIETIKLRLKDNLYGTTIYTPQGRAYIYELSGGYWKVASYQTQPWYDQLDLAQFTPSLLGTLRQPVPGNAHGAFFFSVVQPMRITGTKDLAGVIQIFGTMETLKTIMRGIDFGPNSSLYIVDHDNNIVYSSDYDRLGKPWNLELGIDLSKQRLEAHSQITVLKEKKHLISYNWSSETGWKVVGIVPMENFSEGISNIAVWTGIGVLVGVIVAIILSSLLTYGFTARLQQLSRQIRSVQPNELEFKQEPLLYDEIGYLSSSFRNMIKRIRNLIEEVLKTKILRQEAELKALHSQINPHFLYNVLEAIRMTLNSGNSHAAEAALVSLGHVFRYQVYPLNDHVTVKRELEFIEQYLKIQQLRFGELLDANLSVDDDAQDVLIPRMMLQPIIENAIKYGQSHVDLTIQLTIRIRREHHELQVEIIDEGDGMSDQRLHEVLTGLEEGFTSDHRIGLANVYQRIKHLYEDQGYMSIESMIGTGTIVRLRIPVKTRTEETAS